MTSWARRSPGVDFSPVGVVSRLARVRGHLDGAVDEVFAAHGLGAASFAVLVTLARLGGDEGVSQRRLMDELGLTSGTVSVRVDRLVEAQLVVRAPDPESRRNALITMTDHGRELFERVVPAHLDNERRLLAALAPAEQDVLASLLRKLLVEFEGSRPPPGAWPGLGLVLVPAHVAIAMRESVGLPRADGLLVRGVDQAGPAAVAGVRPGDVLLRAAGRDLRSVAALYAAMSDDAGQRGLRVQLLRGTDEHRVTIALGRAGDVDGSSAASSGRAAIGEHRV